MVEEARRTDGALRKTLVSDSTNRFFEGKINLFMASDRHLSSTHVDYCGQQGFTPPLGLLLNLVLG